METTETYKHATGETYNPLDGRGADFWVVRGDAAYAPSGPTLVPNTLPDKLEEVLPSSVIRVTAI